MTTATPPKRSRTEIPSNNHRFEGFDHLVFYVGNAKLTADWYVSRFGFTRAAFRGLETGHRSAASHVVRSTPHEGGERSAPITFVFTTPYSGGEVRGDYGDEDDMWEHLRSHGDGVKDVAFRVRDCRKVFEEAVKKGATVVRPPTELKDEFGSVVLATIRTYGETVHTFVERSNYRGAFLPGYQATASSKNGGTTTAATSNLASLGAALPPPDLRFIDHVVGNQGEGQMQAVADFYHDKLDFHRFWSVDDKQIHTEYSSLRSIVMADESLTIKMPINEPASGKRKSQIQEFVEYYNGAGVQHIALNTPNCVEAVERLRARGVEFLSVPSKYYLNLRERLAKSEVKVAEDIATIERLNILVDFDESGYLLQIFTKPLHDRPTVFLEIIQRRGNEGFGAGNFKALFEAIEREQEARGNL